MDHDKTPNWLESRNISTPEKIAIIFENKTLTYSQLAKMCRQYAQALSMHIPEIKNGKSPKIGILLPNQPSTIAIIHAISLLGSELVLLNSRLSSSEIEYQVNFLKVDTIVISHQFEDLVRGLENDISITSVDDGQFPLLTLSEEYSEPHFIDLSSTFCYAYTSGTTGDPKAVPITYGNLFYSAIASSFRLGVETEDRWLLTMPLFHLGGLSIVFRSCLYGITIVLHKKFDEDEVITDLGQKDVTLISLVPAMLKRILKALPIAPINHKLRIVLLGGAHAPEQLVTQAINAGFPISVTYGLTESASQFCTATPTQSKIKPGSVGKPLMFSKLEIRNQDKFGVGDIWIQGLTVMNGYVDLVSEKSYFSNGYFNTGDLGYLDEDGDLYVVQRRTDLIISGGENIYPAEIEILLNSIPEIDQAVVIAQDDEKWGQVPVAVIYWHSPATMKTKTEILNQLNDALAGYKIPRKLYIIDKIPRTVSGKIVRGKIVEMVNLGKLTEIE